MNARVLRTYLGRPWGTVDSLIGDQLGLDGHGRYCMPRGNESEAEEHHYFGSHLTVDELARKP